MTALKQNLIDYIKDIPDEKLIAIKPLLYMLYHDTVVIEKVNFDDLTPDEKKAIEEAEKEMAAGEYVRHEDIDWD